jgi:hypothetical protein
MTSEKTKKPVPYYARNRTYRVGKGSIAITLPADFCEQRGISPKDEVTFFGYGDMAILSFHGDTYADNMKADVLHMLTMRVISDITELAKNAARDVDKKAKSGL